MNGHTAQDVARGVSRLLMQEGYSPILEFTLANGRRLDVAALGNDGAVLGVEIKVALNDLKGDKKWPEYLEFCESFFIFAASLKFKQVSGRNGNICVESLHNEISKIFGIINAIPQSIKSKSALWRKKNNEINN